MNDTFDKPRRKRLRLANYNYSTAGAYFITVCTHNRECLLGGVTAGKMVLNDAGRVVASAWDDLPDHNPHLRLDAFVIMPNHIHGIIVLDNPGTNISPAHVAGVSSKSVPAPRRHGLSEIVRQLKTFSSRRINEKRHTPGVPVWRRNYYEHVIRNEDDLNAIREYILHNPLNWDEDEENPQWKGPIYGGAVKAGWMRTGLGPAPTGDLRQADPGAQNRIFSTAVVGAGPRPDRKTGANLVPRAGLEPAPTGDRQPRYAHPKNTVSPGTIVGVGSKPAPTLFLIFNHTFTPAQEEDAWASLGVHRIIGLPEMLKDIWRTIPPDLPEIGPCLEPVVRWLVSEGKKNDYVLIQGDFGACHILVNAAFSHGLIPVYSTTSRLALEEIGGDGSIRLTHHFKHRMFRRYTR